MRTELSREVISKKLNYIKEQYELSREEKSLLESKKTLVQLIDFCNEYDIDGNYYYTLSDLETEIAKENISSLDLEQEEELINKMNMCFQRSRVRNYTLVLANKFYDIHQNRTPEGELWLGKTYMRLGNREKCRYYYEEAEKHFIDAFRYGFNPSCYYHLASSQLKLGNLEEAEQNYLKFLDYDKNTTYRGYIGLIELKSIEGKNESAQLFLEEALTSVPKITKSNKTRLLNCASKNNLELPRNILKKEPRMYIEIGMKSNNNKQEKNEISSPKFNNTLSEEFYKEHTNKIESILSSEKRISLNEIDSYISNLSIPQVEYFLLKLKVAKILSSHDFPKKALQYETEITRLKPKHAAVKQALKNYQKEKVFLKYRGNY